MPAIRISCWFGAILFLNLITVRLVYADLFDPADCTPTGNYQCSDWGENYCEKKEAQSGDCDGILGVECENCVGGSAPTPGFCAATESGSCIGFSRDCGFKEEGGRCTYSGTDCKCKNSTIGTDMCVLYRCTNP